MINLRKEALDHGDGAVPSAGGAPQRRGNGVCVCE